MSQYNYVITIKQPDYKTTDAISLLMLTLALAMFGYVARANWSSRVYHNAAILYVVLDGIIIAWCLYSLAFAKKIKRIPYYRIALATAAVGWFTEPLSNYWLGVLYIIAALIERQVKVPTEIGADAAGITFNSFPATMHVWQNITNVVLKDNILTIDYKSNKFFQKEIETDVSEALEKEFNAYCGEQLNRTALSIISPD